MALEDWVVDNVNDLADDIYDGVRKRTPVRTGTAKAGWEKQYTKEVGDSGSVANDVDYINYLEDGTVKMAPVNMAKATLNEVVNKK